MDVNKVYELAGRFKRLHSGLDIAFGTGRGSWVKRPPTIDDFTSHLLGKGSGIGIAPLRPDNTVLFAAIDLDEPDFEAAREMQKYIPGPSFVERSRSGNSHIWCYFAEPLEAWVAMGLLKMATEAAGKEHVEVFPKNHDFAKVLLGNYINLPYHGDERRVLQPEVERGADTFEREFYSLEHFVTQAENNRNDPEDWRKKAQWMMLSAPEDRPRTTEFGQQENLHICATHILSGAAGPVLEGSRSIVYFNLAKMLTNWKHCDHDEAVDALRSVNEAAGSDSLPDSELMRILSNAERGQFTSTGCDDPVFQSYAHPDCHIANPRSN